MARGVDWQVFLKIGFARKELLIWILHRDPEDIFIRQAKRVLQVEQASDQARAQRRTAVPGPHRIQRNPIDFLPVNEHGLLN